MTTRLSFKIVIGLILLSTTLFLLVEHSLLGIGYNNNNDYPQQIILIKNENDSIKSNMRRRVLFFGYCRHYHDFDAQFAKYSIKSLPNNEFYTINLDELGLNESMEQLNEYAMNKYKLKRNYDKWQWTLWPTCGQYKNNLYLKGRNFIKNSNIYYNKQEKIVYPCNYNTWYHDVYWPLESHVISLSNPSRALIIGMSGEVFWENDYGIGDNIDFELMRSREFPKLKAFTGHWLQSAKGFYRNSYNRQDRNLDLLENNYTKRSDDEWNNIYNDKEYFCVMIVKSIYLRGQYYPDALVRHVLFKLLSKQYKQCHSLGQSYLLPTNESLKRCDDKLGDIGTFICMKPYKFAITMENTLKPGYMSEKIFNAIFADTIPIYFGLPDIYNYNINIDRFIYCNISKNVIMNMRKMQQKHGKIWLFDKTNSNPTDNELIEWATNNLKFELQPCIDEIIKIDNNKQLYMNKLKQSIFKTGSIKYSQFDGYTLGKGFGDMLKTLKSYLFQDL